MSHHSFTVVSKNAVKQRVPSNCLQPIISQKIFWHSFTFSHSFSSPHVNGNSIITTENVKFVSRIAEQIKLGS